MERSVVFAGFAVRELLFTGQVLLGRNQGGLEVFWIPSYGRKCAAARLRARSSSAIAR